MSQEIGLREIANPRGQTGPTISVGGVEVIALSDTEDSGVDAPTKTVERGAEVSQRNTVVPHSGSIDGACRPEDIAALRQQAETREFVSITSSEGSIPQCVVENVERTNEGKHISAFTFALSWRQVFIGSVGTVELTAVTSEGSQSPSAGSEGAEQSQQSLVDSKSNSTNGPEADTGSGEGGSEGDGGDGGGNDGGGGGFLGGIGNAIGDFFS